MSYDSTNNFSSNTNIRTQQRNPMSGSNHRHELTVQPQMTNNYQSHSPSFSSQQTFSSYDTYESHSSNYYPSYTGDYEHQQRPIGRTYYAENPIENPTTISNDHQSSNTTVPIIQTPQGNIGYNSPSMRPSVYPSSQQLHQQGDMYNNNTSSNNPSMNNVRYPISSSNIYRSPYQNVSGKMRPSSQQIRYPSQITWSPNTSSNINESDPTYAYPYNTHPQQMHISTSTNEYRSLSIQDDDNNNNSLKTKSVIPKSPSCTSISSYVPDDIDSSNSSFSDSPSISNEKISKKRKLNQTTSIEIFNKLREMGSEPERNLFVDRLQKLWNEYNIVCRKLPCISRQTIDLYRLYLYIREQNGFEQFSKVAKNRHWRDIAIKLNIPNSSTAAFNIKQKYIQLKLFHYECKYDREGIDPELILIDIQKQQRTRWKNNDEKLTLIQDSSESLLLKQTDMTNPISSISNTNYQLQQVPNSTNHLSKKSDDIFKLHSTSSIPMSFSSNSIEATTISSKIKRKKLTSKDIPSIDPMKLLMSLRAGLLAETTWALDTINIMLNDDQTHTYFRLQKMPSLLQSIVDIYIKCLTELFDEFKTNNKNEDISTNLICETNDKQNSIIYRIESDYLNKYQQILNKQQDIIYEHVYDNNGNIKNNPENIIDLQNTDDLCYIQTHFDPLHTDDHYYEHLYYGQNYSDEYDQELTILSHKRMKICENDNNENSDLLLNISDNNKEFLQRYKRKFQSNEQISHLDLNSCLNINNQDENLSLLFTKYSIGYDQICSRCICVSSILRNLSFISGNDIELIKCKTLIHLLARLLLLKHNNISDKQSKIIPSFSLSECLINIRENTLVTLANISCVLIFDTYDSNIINQLIDGLLHWSTCYSDDARDSLQSSYLSAQNLSIEILTKLSIHDMNIGFILATPPFHRLITLFHILTNWLNIDDINNNITNTYKNQNRTQTYIQREFAIVLLNSLISYDTNISNIIVHIPYIILLLINFLEEYEIKLNELIIQYGLDYIKRLINTQQTDDILFTTNDMLKRAATCLLSIINYTDNIKIMKKYEDRILNLSISNIIDSNIGRILTDILHCCSLYNS